jgi:hypothetical protein
MLLDACRCVMDIKMGKVVTLLAIAIFVELLNHFVVEFWNHSIVDV